jgi:hypothetical protein
MPMNMKAGKAAPKPVCLDAFGTGTARLEAPPSIDMKVLPSANSDKRQHPIAGTGAAVSARRAFARRAC